MIDVDHYQREWSLESAPPHELLIDGELQSAAIQGLGQRVYLGEVFGFLLFDLQSIDNQRGAKDHPGEENNIQNYNQCGSEPGIDSRNRIAKDDKADQSGDQHGSRKQPPNQMGSGPL